MTFGAFISAKRKELRLTLRETAKHLGIACGYLSDVEQSRRPAPEGDFVERISRYLDLSKTDHPQRFEPGRWGHSQREKSDDWRTSGMSGPYDDIISLPHPTSSRHPRMPISDRAAQFSPFAALAGHSAALAETARLTDRQIELSDDDKAVLDQKQRILLEHIKECPEITVTWFRPDEKKDGGQYITTTGRLRRIDEFNQVLILVDDIKIPLTHVVDLDSEKLPDMNQMEW